MLFRRKRERAIQTERRDTDRESRFVVIPKTEGALRLSIFSKSGTAVENITITAKQVDHLRSVLLGIQEFPHSITIEDKKNTNRTYNEDGPNIMIEASRGVRLTVENKKDCADLLAAIQ